ncbi:MAG: hypothetical protein LIP12_12065 [Clostridiales bacterium]|nr:hypothetical protein [Clostridiales bacterium]
MMRKKIFTLAMTVLLLLGLSMTALADPVALNEATSTIDAKQQNTVTITKKYTATNDGTTSPAETFKFTVTPVSFNGATDSATLAGMPAVTVTDLEVLQGNATAAGTSNNLTVNLPVYSSVGIYVYKIVETPSQNAGVTTDPTEYYLRVTVSNGNSTSGLVIEGVALHAGDPDTKPKVSTISNTYDAGTLSISKTVSGNQGDKGKYFAVKVTLTAETGKTYASSYAVSGGSSTDNPTTITVGQETTFYLKDGETINIANLPYGVTYTVVENDYTTSEGYEAATYSVSSDGTVTTTSSTTAVSGEALNHANETVAITNTKGTTADTGVILDSLPYILILVIVFIGVVFLVFRKRTSDRY